VLWMVVDEMINWKDLDRSGRNLLGVLSWHLSAESEKTPQKNSVRLTLSLIHLISLSKSRVFLS
jgi:hypothetical protein